MEALKMANRAIFLGEIIMCDLGDMGTGYLIFRQISKIPQDNKLVMGDNYVIE